MGWSAALELGFAADGGLTRLAHRAHRGPLQVQRAFLPEGPDLCHVYLLHPPGGLVGGDELRVDVRVGPAARALVTTPAATKAYRTRGPAVSQQSALAVDGGGALEWLPQETILFDGASATLDTRVDLAPGARFIGCETLCFGLPARGEPFARGSCRQAFEMFRAGAPVLIERGRFDGGAPVHAAPWGLGGARVLGLLVAAPAPAADVVDGVSALAAVAPAGDRAGVTVVGGGDALVARYLGGAIEPVKAFQHAAWRLLRPALLGRAAVAPRIWAT